MTHLKYEGGPLNGQSYPLAPNQVAPLAIRKKEWGNTGHYQLVVPSKKSLTQFAPYLEWRGR